MAFSSSDTSGSGSGRSRSLKLQPTATGPMDLSEFYTNKGYVSETWWKDYFMTVLRPRQPPRHRRDVDHWLISTPAADLTSIVPSE